MFARSMLCLLLSGALAACGGTAADREQRIADQRANIITADSAGSSRLRDLFRDTNDDVKIGVNRYLWAASLDTLSVLPIEAADPFSGVISTGWGRVSGASTPYRVTVYITQPALDARALRVAVFRQSGGRAVAVTDDVAATVEDAILTRARQLQVAEIGRQS
ncbi:MAG: DUF3576 domain-containing protein [Pseudomonadota bacterium]